MFSSRQTGSRACALVLGGLVLSATGTAGALSLPSSLQQDLPVLGELRPLPPAPAPALPGWPEEFEQVEPPPASGEVEPVGASPEAAPAPLLFPVAGGRQTGLEKHFLSRRGRRLHHALDIVAPRNTPIRAVGDGTIVRLHRSRRGGIGVEQLDAAGQYCFYYAHLQRYAPGLKVGQSVSRDDLLGFVGSTGYTRGPHLHFQVMKLGASGDCWLDSKPLDPYPLLERQRAAPATLADPALEAE